MKIKPHHYLTLTLIICGLLASWVLKDNKDNHQLFVGTEAYANDIATINQKLDKLTRALKYIEALPHRAETEVTKKNTASIATSGIELAGSDSLLSEDESSPVEFEQDTADGSGQQPEASKSRRNELEQMQNIVWQLERELSHQEDDTSWYPQAEDAIHSALGNEIFSQSSLANVSCRATMCRIDIAHANQEAEMAFLSEINTVAGFSDTEAFYTREVDLSGGVSMTYYLSREGHRLPRLATVY